jgi:hypothetical protein
MLEVAANGSNTNKPAADAAAKPDPDQHFSEGLNILADYIQQLGGTHAQN